MAEISRRTLFNRALLVSALGGGALLGLTRPIRHRVAVPPPPAPAALVDALARQQRLLAGYDRALAARAAHPALPGLRADIVAHGAALRAALERYPGWRLARVEPAGGDSTTRARPTPTSTSAPGGVPALAATVPALAAASRAGAAAASRACLNWPGAGSDAAEVATLLASIAACLSSHAQVLA